MLAYVRTKTTLGTITSQKAVARMSVAVNDRYGENKRVYRHSVICWKGLAETVSAFLHKGRRMAITDSNLRSTGIGFSATPIAPTCWQIQIVPHKTGTEALIPEGNE